MDAFVRLAAAFTRAKVRFLLIGLSGANLYARSASEVFATQDRDLFLPCDPATVLTAWQTCEELGLDLICRGEPLDRPRDRLLAERVIANRALVRATDFRGLDADLTLVMTGFDFAAAWRAQRTFRVDGVDIPVARLAHINESKRRTGRDKDRLFLTTHRAAVEDLLTSDQTAVRRTRKKPSRAGTSAKPRRR